MAGPVTGTLEAVWAVERGSQRDMELREEDPKEVFPIPA